MLYYLHQSPSVSGSTSTDSCTPSLRRSWSRAVSIDELLYLSGEHNYSWLHSEPSQPILVSVTLKRLLAQLPDKQFVRIHRSYVVNRQFVARIETQTTGHHWLFLSTGQRLPVSRRRWVAVRRQLGAELMRRSVPRSLYHKK